MILAFENLTLMISARQDADERNIRMEVTTMYDDHLAAASLTVTNQTEYEHHDPIEMYAQVVAGLVRRTLQAVEGHAPTLTITRVPDPL